MCWLLSRYYVCTDKTVKKNFILAASNPTWHDAIMAINTNSIHHIHVSVTDIERSRAYYEGLFGWPIAFEMPADTRKAKNALCIPLRRRHRQHGPRSSGATAGFS